MVGIGELGQAAVPTGLWARAGRLRRRLAEHPTLCWLACAVFVVGIAVGAEAAGPNVVPPGLVSLPILLGGLLLRPRTLRRLLVLAALALVVDLLLVGFWPWRPLGQLVTLAGALVAYQLSRVRAQAGLSAEHSEAILLELRDRLRRHGELPVLPPGWRAEATLETAGGSGFGGDFVVAARSAGRLEVALVDVSGKGVVAAGRALQLSGALGGLLGAVDPSRFLSAANSYVDRQGWLDGFATAAYLSLDLATGRYEVRSAGHPPLVRFDAGSGLWCQSAAAGPVLGVLDPVEYEPETGTLQPGDALLLYTDGVVEVPGRALEVGIDRLLGAAERLVPVGFDGGSEQLLAATEGAEDDRAVLLLWRTATPALIPATPSQHDDRSAAGRPGPGSRSAGPGTATAG